MPLNLAYVTQALTRERDLLVTNSGDRYFAIQLLARSRLHLIASQDANRFLIGEPYPDDHTYLKPLKPFPRNSDYDGERLVKGLAFVDQLLRSWKRNHPQVLEQTMIMYKGDLMNELEDVSLEMAEDPDGRSFILSCISLCEKDIYDKMVVNGAPDLRTLDPDDLPRKLIDLRQYMMAARYGDKLDECSWRLTPRLKSTADFRGRDGWDTYWEILFRRIQLRGRDPFKTRKHIGAACQLLGMDTDETVRDIERYVFGDDLAHKSIDKCMRSGDVAWPEVATAIGRDLHDLVSIFPEYSQRALSWVREYTCQVALAHFIAPREFPLLTGAWFPKKMFRDEEELARHGMADLNDVYYTRGLWNGKGPVYLKGPM